LKVLFKIVWLNKNEYENLKTFLKLYSIDKFNIDTCSININLKVCYYFNA